MSAGQATFDAFRRTLTGFEEIFISKEFGKPLLKLVEDDTILGMRAVIAVDLKRGGEKDPRNKSLELTQGDVEDWFLDDEPEQTPEEENEAIEAGEA